MPNGPFESRGSSIGPFWGGPRVRPPPFTPPSSGSRSACLRSLPKFEPPTLGTCACERRTWGVEAAPSGRASAGLLGAAPALVAPGRGKQERDLERDRAAGGRAGTSEPRPARKAGRRSPVRAPGARSPGKTVGWQGRRARGSPESRAALKQAASWQRDPVSTLEAAAFGRGVAVWRGGAVGAGSWGPASQRVPAKRSGGPPSGALSWGFHPSGTGAGAEAKGRSGAQ